jgi:hypothetical protein
MCSPFYYAKSDLEKAYKKGKRDAIRALKKYQKNLFDMNDDIDKETWDIIISEINKKKFKI